MPTFSFSYEEYFEFLKKYGALYNINNALDFLLKEKGTIRIGNSSKQKTEDDIDIDDIDMLAELVEETNRHKKKTKDSEPKLKVRGLTAEEIEKFLPW